MDISIKSMYGKLLFKSTYILYLNTDNSIERMITKCYTIAFMNIEMYLNEQFNVHACIGCILFLKYILLLCIFIETLLQFFSICCRQRQFQTKAGKCIHVNYLIAWNVQIGNSVKHYYF